MINDETPPALWVSRTYLTKIIIKPNRYDDGIYGIRNEIICCVLFCFHGIGLYATGKVDLYEGNILTIVNNNGDWNL